MSGVTVFGNATTKIQSFPPGTKETPWLFELFDKDGIRVSFIEQPVPGTIFPGVAQGEKFTMKVTRNGVSASAEFVTPIVSSDISVPVSLTITFDGV